MKVSIDSGNFKGILILKVFEICTLKLILSNNYCYISFYIQKLIYFYIISFHVFSEINFYVFLTVEREA